MKKQDRRDISGPNEPRNVTLSDIAAALGVSKATVSLAMNHDPKVAAKTRQKVLQKIKELGYVYNRGAAELSKGNTSIVGLAVHDFTNPYFTHVCAAIEEVLSQSGRIPFLCNSHESVEYQSKFIRTLCEYRVDGIIMCPVVGTTPESLQLLSKRGMPTVLFTRAVPGAGLDFVCNNDSRSMQMATEHLISLGHRKIVLVGGGLLTSSAVNRREGFLKTMVRRGLPVNPDMMVDCEFSPLGGEEAIHRIMSWPDPPTAAACLTDRIALGVLSGLHKLGLRPGRDLAVTGCDDIEEAARGYVQLTTVRINKIQMGLEATAMLMNRIADPSLPRQKKVTGSELIIRKSCGADL
jgi:LacI family transcriptional regulator